MFGWMETQAQRNIVERHPHTMLNINRRLQVPFCEDVIDASVVVNSPTVGAAATRKSKKAKRKRVITDQPSVSC